MSISSLGNKEWVLTKESFDSLLAWLDPNRDQAGRKYEDIRRKLIKIFTCRGCLTPEELADETINRVAKRVPDVAGTYTGDPALYFYGVAQKVQLEYLRRKLAPLPPLPPEPAEDIEQEYECLEKCMQQLTEQNRELVLQYYREEKQAKIDHRKELAQKLDIGLNALRIRAHRIRASLQDCVLNCLERRAIQ